MSRSPDAAVAELLEEHATTYASAAGIRLKDKPSPLYQLLVLTMLSSARISADLAVAAARELFAAGWRTPQRMRDATWQQRVDALGWAGYRRDDESTSTQLEKGAAQLLEEHSGDLRRLRPGGSACLRTRRSWHGLRRTVRWPGCRQHSCVWT